MTAAVSLVTTPGPTAEPDPDPAPTIAPPAVTWRHHDLPPTDFMTVILAGDRLFTVGAEPGGDPERRVILSSEDGITWSVWSRPSFDGDVLQDLMWVDGEFIAIVFHRIIDAEPVGGTTAAWASPDGKAWRQWFDLGDEGPFPQAFAKVGGRWIATVKPDGPIMTSDDGERWQMTLERRFGVNGRPIPGPGGVVIPAPGDQIGDGGGSQLMLHSADGLRWSETVLDAGQIAEVLSTAADDRVYVALGNARPDEVGFALAGWWSTDGRGWQRSSLPTDLDGQIRIDAAAAIAGGFIALSREDAPVSPRMLWSPDGRSWIILEGGPVGQIALPRMIVVGNRLLLYLQPYESEEWALWEATVSE